MVAGLSKVICPLLAANALEATSRASPMITVFETVANFIAAPFFSPDYRDRFGAARFANHGRKHFVFPQESPTMLAAGVKRTSSQACASAMGVPSPGPPNRARENPQTPLVISLEDQSHLCFGPFAHPCNTLVPRSKFLCDSVRLTN